KKKIELINEVSEDLYVYTDRGMFSSILQNLVSNAIKFTNIEGKVRVNAVEKDSLVEISVIDNGVGISEDTLQKLFKIDSKVSTMGTAGEAGTGLGLNLVKEYVNLNKGEIWVTSKKGEGSTFTFTLPKVK
ncbi:MAG: HAMP domain-containing histidine kinase, partial [Ignavibacteria bacterium]|nr:HAMP domain-containing histidine kinase [Ignavibacteria bacterium]